MDEPYLCTMTAKRSSMVDMHLNRTIAHETDIPHCSAIHDGNGLSVETVPISIKLPKGKNVAKGKYRPFSHHLPFSDTADDGVDFRHLAPLVVMRAKAAFAPQLHIVSESRTFRIKRTSWHQWYEWCHLGT